MGRLGRHEFRGSEKDAMVRNQIEIFRRGFLDLPQAVVQDDILAKAAYPEFEQLGLLLKDFSAAYAYEFEPDAIIRLKYNTTVALAAVF